jgi:ribosomal protein S21
MNYLDKLKLRDPEVVSKPLDAALRNWKKKIPINRAGRRNQLSQHKYYLELNESDTFWSVYAVKKDGNKILLDNSANHAQKKEAKNNDDPTPEIVD